MNSDQQIFTREELRERRALLTQKRKEQMENKKKTKAERDWGSGQTLRERDPW